MNFPNYNPNIQFPLNNGNGQYNYQPSPYQQHQQQYHPQQQYLNQNVYYGPPAHQQYNFPQQDFVKTYNHQPPFHKQQSTQYNSYGGNSGSMSNQQVSGFCYIISIC